MKKAFSYLFSLSLFPILVGGFVHANEENLLTYWDLLYAYFSVVNPEHSDAWLSQTLKYTNLSPDQPLYPVLQSAVQADLFPNLPIALPLQKMTFESDLADLLEYTFWKKIDFIPGKLLSLERLKNELVLLFKEQLWDTFSDEVLSGLQSHVAQTVFSLLQEQFIFQERLGGKMTPEYNELSGFVASLGDPYSRYYSPEEWIRLMESLHSSFVGIGVVLTQTGAQYPLIAQVLLWWAAEKAWLKKGDLIKKLDGRDYFEYEDLESFITDVRGKEWTSLVLQIQRGDQTFDFPLTRAHFHLPSFWVEKKRGVCYFPIASFDIGMSDDFLEQYRQLQPCSFTVFDLRGNPGGVLDEALALLEVFIEKGKPLLQVEYLHHQDVISVKEQKLTPFTWSVAVLIDENTASAAEIFAGVLKYYYPKQVALIGTQSFGKGSVQELVQFPEASILKYTVALWKIANSDASINHVGLQPDLILQDDPNTLEDEVLSFFGFSF